MSTKPRRVDYFYYDEDFECAYLGDLGFSTRFIMQKTRLSPGQITYRLHKAHIRRMDYRNGTSQTATIVLRNLRPVLKRNLTEFLRRDGQ